MRQGERTSELLKKHYRTYPNLQMQDIFKFLYQSAFGCEHLVSSTEKVMDYIREEYKNVDREETIQVDRLDGNYSRVHLSCLNEGLQIETLGKMFCYSAKTEKDGLEKLLQKLQVAKALVREGQLPFDEDDFVDAVRAWELRGYPAVHHSQQFRNTYQPSYRVIANEYIPFIPMIAKLDQLLLKDKVTFAIEGGSASGKTTLSKMLSKLYDCTVFHMDDFFLRPEQRTSERYAQVGGNVDRERFLEEVLIPRVEEKDIVYRKFECATMSLGEEIRVKPKNLVIVEGAYSMHPELREYYDSSVFLDVDSKVQRERILQRNSGSMAQRFFDEWIPLEEVYFSEMNIKEHCNMVIHFNEKD